MDGRIEWYRHAQAAGFVFLKVARGAPEARVTGWAQHGSTCAGKFQKADHALLRYGAGTCNLAVGIEHGTRNVILDGVDAQAVEAVESLLGEAGVTTLSIGYGSGARLAVHPAARRAGDRGRADGRPVARAPSPRRGRPSGRARLGGAGDRCGGRGPGLPIRPPNVYPVAVLPASLLKVAGWS